MGDHGLGASETSCIQVLSTHPKAFAAQSTLSQGYENGQGKKDEGT